MGGASAQSDFEAGTARLKVVVGVSLISFLGTSILEYSLPLYFNALKDFPRRMWADLIVWQVAPWCLGPILAGLLARRYGERRVWGAALAGVLMLAGFALAAAGIGLAGTPAALFIAVGVFEFVWQFMRWLNSGYLSEHMPANLPATAIGCAITGAGGSVARCSAFSRTPCGTPTHPASDRAGRSGWPPAWASPARQDFSCLTASCPSGRRSFSGGQTSGDVRISR